MTWSTALRDIAADIHKGTFSMAVGTSVWRRFSFKYIVTFIAHPVVHCFLLSKESCIENPRFLEYLYLHSILHSLCIISFPQQYSSQTPGTASIAFRYPAASSSNHYQSKPCSLCFLAMVLAKLSRDLKSSSLGNPLLITGSSTSALRLGIIPVSCSTALLPQP